MTPLLKRIYESPGGSECLDVLMKYMYGSFKRIMRRDSARLTHDCF